MVFGQERTGIEKKFYDLCSDIVSSQGLSLYDLEYVTYSGELRAFIIDESTGTAIIEDCVKVDRAIGEALESADWLPEKLTLEVSSPGVYRKLTELEHFRSVKGQRISLTFIKRLKDEEIENLPTSLKSAKKCLAFLDGVTDTGLSLTLENKSDQVFMNFEHIQKANLEPEIGQSL